MVAGELPAHPTQLSEGSGPVTIDANVIQANLANDDGGGVRLLQTSGSHISRANPETIAITNNTIANNVSAHEGGGLALDDAAFVNMVNNTVARNITTATAVTSDGSRPQRACPPAPTATRCRRGCATPQLFPGSATLGSTLFSKPTILNDVFWDNRAGSFSGGWARLGHHRSGRQPLGHGCRGRLRAALTDQLGHPDGRLGTDGGSATTLSNDPVFVAPYDVAVNILPLRTYPAFRQAVIVALILPPSLMGDYHLLNATSPAYGRGTGSVRVRWGGTTQTNAWIYTVPAPNRDIDGNNRPSGNGANRRYDAGSDQFQP